MGSKFKLLVTKRISNFTSKHWTMNKCKNLSHFPWYLKFITVLLKSQFIKTNFFVGFLWPFNFNFLLRNFWQVPWPYRIKFTFFLMALTFSAIIIFLFFNSIFYRCQHLLQAGSNSNWRLWPKTVQEKLATNSLAGVQQQPANLDLQQQQYYVAIRKSFSNLLSLSLSLALLVVSYKFVV